MNKYEIIRYYQWGDEKPGYVRTWRIGKDGSIKHGEQVRIADLPKDAIRDCPYN